MGRRRVEGKGYCAWVCISKLFDRDYENRLACQDPFATAAILTYHRFLRYIVIIAATVFVLPCFRCAGQTEGSPTLKCDPTCDERNQVLTGFIVTFSCLQSNEGGQSTCNNDFVGGFVPLELTVV